MRLLACLALAALALPAGAQPVTTTADLYDWPLSVHDAPPPPDHWRPYDVLPFIRRLTLTLEATDAGEAPRLAARLSWQMGSEGIKKGRRVPARQMPDGVALVAFVLRADVVQNGARVAGFTLAVDSTRLASGQMLDIAPAATWAVLFDGVDADAARRIVGEGFTIENLQLVRAAFGVYDGRQSRNGRAPRVRDGSVYDAYPDVWVDVAWNLAWLGVRDGAYATAAPRPRHARGDRDSSSSDDDEKKDKNGELLPAAAMIGVALVGGAVLGGSAGIAVQTDEPLGFATGIVRARGGALLQASANGAALGLADGDESITAQIIGFGGGAGQKVQPALGLGVRAHEQRGDLQVDPALTLGAMFRLGKASLLAGYEVFGGRPAFGLIYSWKMR